MSFIPCRCAWCGAKSAESFCKRCYGPLDGQTKCSMRSLIAKGAPQHARRIGLGVLSVLEQSGVPIPERRSDHVAQESGVQS